MGVIRVLLLVVMLAVSGAYAQGQQGGQCCGKGCGKAQCQGQCKRHGQGRGEGQSQGQGHRRGQKGTQGQGMGRGMQQDAAHQADMELFHFLLDNGDGVKRTVFNLENGVETVTESEKPEVIEAIHKHVYSMKARVEEGRPIHRRDPLFAAIFDHADKITMKVEKTEKGVRVAETSEDPYVAKLIQAHAEVVTQFIANGRAEARKNHEVPQ